MASLGLPSESSGLAVSFFTPFALPWCQREKESEGGRGRETEISLLSTQWCACERGGRIVESDFMGEKECDGGESGGDLVLKSGEHLLVRVIGGDVVTRDVFLVLERWAVLGV